jgi:hypothetical protein
MESITIYVKDKKQIGFLYQLLQHIDFVVMPYAAKQKAKNKGYDFFKSAGLWENRDITQHDLRAKAGKRE